MTAGFGPRDRRGRATKILEILDRLHPDVDSFLEHADAFQLLVAVILSAQCTDARVNQVTPALFARAPDARAMAGMTERELVTYIRSCGLAPSKARNIIAMSQQLVERYGGLVPEDVAAMEELPGVGHKTACVVASQAFGAQVFPVDTHIHRLAGRWQLSRARNVDEVERDLMAVFPRERWNTLHLQLIEFGRAYCTAKAHEPSACPICSWAMSKARARAEIRHGLSKPNIPRKRRKPAKPAKPGKRNR
jgi:endonuclease-3